MLGILTNISYLCRKTIMKKFIDINEINKLYNVTEDWQVYSYIRKRWLKPQRNNCGYIHYHFKPYGWVFIHTIVALKYIGPPPMKGLEINHIDGNRGNNHWTNLEWVTHSQNHLKAYENGKEHYWLNKHRPSPSLETRMKMANAKNKRISYNGIIYESIQEMSDKLHINRRTISRILHGYKHSKYNGIELIPDSLE